MLLTYSIHTYFLKYWQIAFHRKHASYGGDVQCDEEQHGGLSVAMVFLNLVVIDAKFLSGF